MARRAAFAAPCRGLCRSSSSLHLKAVEALDDTGFFVSGCRVQGSIAVAGDSVLVWRAKNVNDVTAESLALANMLLPTPEFVILGLGRGIPAAALERERLTSNLLPGMRVDAMETWAAVATFNVLSMEGRACVLFALPQKK